MWNIDSPGMMEYRKLRVLRSALLTCGGRLSLESRLLSCEREPDQEGSKILSSCLHAALPGNSFGWPDEEGYR
jgi:hypothetical protein